VEFNKGGFSVEQTSFKNIFIISKIVKFERKKNDKNSVIISSMKLDTFYSTFCEKEREMARKKREREFLKVKICKLELTVK